MERMTRVRAGILLILFCVILIFFSLKLYNMIVMNPNGSNNNEKTFTTITRVKAARGDILDRNGNVLVTNRASYDLVFNHFVICSADDPNGHLLRLVRLCRETGIEYTEHLPLTKDAPFAYTITDYSSAWQGYFQSFLLKNDLDSDISAPLLFRILRDQYRIPAEWSDADARAVIGLRYELSLRQGITNLPIYVFLEDVSNDQLASVLELNIPGIKTEASTVRVYNTKYAAHILGFVGSITADQWDKTYKNQPGYEMDALVGQDGLEEAFESYLHGVDGYRVDVVYADGTLKDSYYQKDKTTGKEKKPVSGQNVFVSIDLGLQTTAENSLATLIEALRATAEEGKEVDGADAEGGAVVVMNVKTGQVLACASYPTYDLSTFRENFEELKNAEYAPMFNRALLATYPPGSTYKMSMVVAGINTETVRQYQTIQDKGVFTKYAGEDGKGFSPKCLQYTNYGTFHQNVNAMVALQKSCNYYFYELSDNMDIADMDATAKGLGLGESTGIELFEYLGTRANAENKAKLYAGDLDMSRWYTADKIMASIGQSINRFTPMQLCVYVSTLANRGTRYQATFLNRVVSSDYKSVVMEQASKVMSKFTISDEAYAAYSQGMKMVTLSGGTAYKIFGDYPIPFAAKTGTAETDSGISDNGAFVCYAPFNDPEIAIAVYGENAGHGSTMGQIAKAIMDDYFHVGSQGTTNGGENQVS